MRPLRSVLIGDVDHYPSEYAFGVNQAMTRAGHWHSSINIRHDIGTIAKRVNEVHPDVIWGHMLLWAPGSEAGNKTVDLLCLCDSWRARGTRVFLHDGDARVDTRFPMDISPAVDVALCNHKADRSRWKVRQLHWPYFAFDQIELAEPVEDLRCDLFFAGRFDTSPLYLKRTELVFGLKEKLGARMRVGGGENTETKHTLFRTSEYAVSAGAVLGFGRPERNGWLDVRVFQYPGAGAILLHDDVGGFLEPWVHYVPYEAGSIESILGRVDEVTSSTYLGSGIRRRAFDHVQTHHSATARVRQALAAVELTL